MTCRGICTRHRATRPSWGAYNRHTPCLRYASGQKRCQVCEIFIKWDGLFCPCCGYRLRLKPRHKKFKGLLAKAANQVVIAA